MFMQPLLTHSFAYRTYFPPSVWADFFVCKRRFYYQANHLFPTHDPDMMSGFHTQFDDQDWWMREVRLPSGSRIDLWIAEEKVAIEYKTVAPEFAHAVQVWEMQEELMQLGLPMVQFQLWYDVDREAQAWKFAREMGWDYGKNDLGYISLLVQPPGIEQLYELERTKQYMMDHIQQKDEFISQSAENKGHCATCRFYEFCHA